MKTIKGIYTAVGAALIITVACNSQAGQKDAKAKTVNVEKTEGVNPKIKTRVNKQYDSKGNLMKFDSTYSYFYTSKGNDSTKVGLDTLVKEFKSYYSQQMTSGINRHFNDIFLTDSLFKYDFLNDDYFRKRFELNMAIMHDMFKQMDSLKTHYLKTVQTRKTTEKTKPQN